MLFYTIFVITVFVSSGYHVFLLTMMQLYTILPRYTYVYYAIPYTRFGFFRSHFFVRFFFFIRFCFLVIKEVDICTVYAQLRLPVGGQQEIDVILCQFCSSGILPWYSIGISLFHMYQPLGFWWQQKSPLCHAKVNWLSRENSCTHIWTVRSCTLLLLYTLL